jgi:hypothetical protein
LMRPQANSAPYPKEMQQTETQVEVGARFWNWLALEAKREQPGIHAQEQEYIGRPLYSLKDPVTLVRSRPRTPRLPQLGPKSHTDDGRIHGN